MGREVLGQDLIAKNEKYIPEEQLEQRKQGDYLFDYIKKQENEASMKK